VRSRGHVLQYTNWRGQILGVILEENLMAAREEWACGRWVGRLPSALPVRRNRGVRERKKEREDQGLLPEMTPVPFFSLTPKTSVPC
jgi:hypothetical protein